MARNRLSRRNKIIALFLLHMSNHASVMASYYHRYFCKTPCFNSPFTEIVWMREIMESGSEVRCINAFRMERFVLQSLCDELQQHHGLTPSRNVSVLEKVGILLHTLVVDASNRASFERFQRSGDAISRVLHEVVDAITGRRHGTQGLAGRLLRPRDPSFSQIPEEIRCDSRYQLFKGAIGCIDGTHIAACIPRTEQMPYRNRKQVCSLNIMAVCDFDMFFTFDSVGWEGSAHDARVFDHALRTPELNFPHPPPRRYYLVDKGYPDRQGYMVPYSKVKYHQSQFQNKVPKDAPQAFNKMHSSLRSCIERCLGVLKKRFRVLHNMASYPIKTQIDIIIVCFAMHNFILEKRVRDRYLEEDYEDPDLPPPRIPDEGEDDATGGMKALRD